MHRDIKPDNILCNSQGFVKLTDFGITKQMDEEQMAATFVGTMNYMSPERMEGEKYSFEGDIWSLGIVIIELITGIYPF
jgi:serine/threonine protein kinase